MPELPRPEQEHFVAPVDETPLVSVDRLDTEAPPSSQWREAWRKLRVRPLFWVSVVLLAVITVVVVFPGLFTDQDPRHCVLGRSRQAPGGEHLFGTDNQGCDVYARTVYGARASVLVGALTAAFVFIVGLVTGALAGFYGGWIDSLLSRVTDIFFAIPLLLAAIVGLSVYNNLYPQRTFWVAVSGVVLVLGAFGWPQVMRIARGAVLEVKNLEFIDAAQAIGSTRRRNLIRHAIPNALAPVIVVSTVSLGVYIVAEATLSFLGVGLPSNVVSWGNDLSKAQQLVRGGEALHAMYFPAAALAITVLAFILLGDAVRDALDPKAKKR